MSKRLPRPEGGKRVRLEFTPAELERIEDMAHDCRMTVSSLLRAVMLDTMAHWPHRIKSTKETFARVIAEWEASPGVKKKPGRPRKEK